jgi:hypothetical protein
MGGGEMKWEYQLMRDMLERATLYLSVPTLECRKTGDMLRQAASVMSHWNREMIKMEIALTKIRDCDSAITPPDRIDTMCAIAREALIEHEH